MIKCGRPRKGEESLSRDRLLDTALKLFLEHGYGNLSLETIARDARVSMRTIYSQFGGKAGLFGAVIKRCSDPFVTVLSEESALEGRPEEALVAFARQFLMPSHGRMRCAYAPYSLVNRCASLISPRSFMNRDHSALWPILRNFSPGNSKRAILSQ